MKKILLSIILVGICVLSQAQRQKVHSFIKQEQTQSWYTEQGRLWKEYLTTNKRDADAWLNYYTAKRMIRVCGGKIEQKVLDDVVNEAKVSIPNTFEYHYIAFWNSDISKLEQNAHHLEKAYMLEPDRNEILDDYMSYYELKRNKKKLEEVAKKWYASNDMAAGLYYWNYNVLQSLESNAILITSGDNDTYPVWVLQWAKGVRKDVSVLNHSMIGLAEYRKLYFKELSIPEWPFTYDSFDSYPAFQSAMLQHIKKHTNRPVYFAISAQPQLYKDFKKDIYNVGMAYKWSDQKFDNIAVTKKNYEKKYMLDYLQLDASNHISQNVVEHMNANYLISLFPLYNHYLESEDGRSEKIKSLIISVAEKSNMLEEVNKILKQAE